MCIIPSSCFPFILSQIDARLLFYTANYSLCKPIQCLHFVLPSRWPLSWGANGGGGGKSGGLGFSLWTHVDDAARTTTVHKEAGCGMLMIMQFPLCKSEVMQKVPALEYIRGGERIFIENLSWNARFLIQDPFNFSLQPVMSLAMKICHKFFSCWIPTIFQSIKSIVVPRI